MDLDYLHKLVSAARDEAEAIGGDGPAYEAIGAYLSIERRGSGREAEELRAGIEKIVSDPPGGDCESNREWVAPLRRLLDSVDARDSLAFLEQQDGERQRVQMTDDEIRSTRRLCDAATPGPWKPCGANNDRCICGLVWANEHVPLQGDDIEPNPTADDAAFIAAARTMVPALLDEVERLRVDRDECRRTIADAVRIQAAMRRDTDLMRPVYEAARAWRPTILSLPYISPVSPPYAQLVRAVDAALAIEGETP